MASIVIGSSWRTRHCRAGVRRVILPERNRADVEEIPADVREKIEFVFASSYRDVAAAAFDESPIESEKAEAQAKRNSTKRSIQKRKSTKRSAKVARGRSE